jgi:hypothetical protein
VKHCFKDIKETPSEDGIVRIIYFHQIKGYVLSTSVAKDTGNDTKPIGSILLLPEPYRGLDASFSCFLSKLICSKVKRNMISA